MYNSTICASSANSSLLRVVFVGTHSHQCLLVVPNFSYQIHLLDLLGGLLSQLGLFTLASSLGSLWAGLSIHDIVPPSETAGVVTDEALVVGVVVVGAGVEREEVMQTPGKIITAVGVNGLEEA